MKKEDLIKAIPTLEELYIIYSAFTRVPYIECDSETFLDKAFFFFKEEDAKEFCEKLAEEKRQASVVKLGNKEMILQAFTTLFLYGIDAVEMVDGEERTLLELSEFVRRPDISNIPQEQRPVENPTLNLTINHFLQEFRRQVEPPTSEKIRALESEMVANILKSKYLLPFRPNENSDDKQVQLLLVKADEERFMIPVFTDGYEFAKFRGADESIKPTVANLDNLFSIVLPENTIGFVLNPAGASLTLAKEWIDKVKENRKELQ